MVLDIMLLRTQAVVGIYLRHSDLCHKDITKVRLCGEIGFKFWDRNYQIWDIALPEDPDSVGVSGIDVVLVV